jgi:hypothetical protein
VPGEQAFVVWMSVNDQKSLGVQGGFSHEKHFTRSRKCYSELSIS